MCTDQIKKNFPWFFRMKTLVGEDPRVDKESATNSATDDTYDLLKTKGSGYSTATPGGTEPETEDIVCDLFHMTVVLIPDV